MFSTRASDLLWAITSAIGASFCLIVLLVVAAVWWNPKSRPHLDRVSFRIVTVALFVNMLFGISSTVGGILTEDSFLCGFSIFVLQLTLQFSSFLLFCIVLNLQLVVLYGLDGQKLERYYFIGSFLMSIILVIPPYAAGQYGWDPLEQVCWYTNDDPRQRIAWQIGTQMAWTAMLAFGEIAASVSVTIFMLKHRIRTRQIFVSTSGTGTVSSSPPQVVHANNYKRIIIRIALYPLASCFVNVLSIFTALHSTLTDGIHDQEDYNILLLSDFLYGGRAIVYALLAASDPALVRGVQTLYHSLRGSHNAHSIGKPSSNTSGSPTRSSSQSLVVQVELSTIRDYLPSEASIDDLPSRPEPSFVPSHKEGMIDVPMKSGSASQPRNEYRHSRCLPSTEPMHEEILRQEQAFHRQI
ncbi:hypothetical protein EV368DRAFT_82866 [Lentinula lateritia]|uniref:Uncharacterized protein n=1 Tax=Lentinula aff. lateritia TaxID=2804960 RepID=A0ACC1U8D8_9AGAR|nr:hypothetical protein F5876DRAFT_74434 [Lentinula aff. lateritia]KAJ3852119.1 hypothetical protein EV368DRAFT_82866 [Lentinula lateritia]